MRTYGNPKSATPGYMYIACTSEKEFSKDLMKLVDEGTNKLRQSGELQIILDKYGLKDWQ